MRHQLIPSVIALSLLLAGSVEAQVTSAYAHNSVTQCDIQKATGLASTSDCSSNSVIALGSSAAASRTASADVAFSGVGGWGYAEGIFNGKVLLDGNLTGASLLFHVARNAALT